MIKNHKIGTLCPVRLSSERLPGKQMLEIKGRTVLEHLVDRMRASKYSQEVIICATTDPADDPLEEFCGRIGVSLWRGSINDILQRFLDAAEAHDLSDIIEVDGDDLFCDPQYMDRCLEAKWDYGADVAIATGLPLGVTPKAFDIEVLRRLCALKDTEDTEHGFGYYFTDMGLFNVFKIQVLDERHRLAEARLTLDYQVDLDCFRLIFDELYREGEIFSIGDIIALLKERPDIMAVNRSVSDEYWRRSEEKLDLRIRKEPQ